MIRAIIFILLFNYNGCDDISAFFERRDEDVVTFNSMAAEIAWGKAQNNVDRYLETRYQLKTTIWHDFVCKKIAVFFKDHLLNKTQARQAYLMCRGPKFPPYNEDFIQTYETIRKMYDEAKICVPNTGKISTNLSYIEEAILNYKSSIQRYFNFEDEQLSTAVKIGENLEDDNVMCLKGEREVDKIMKSRNENTLKWVWLSWRENFQPLGEPYAKLVKIENEAARNNGYNNIGECWRDEVEVQNLKEITLALYKEIRPLYELLHGVVRYYLRKEYGNIVPERGPIPAHLLGGLWSHNWESLIDLIVPQAINLDKRIKQLNWTVEYMLKRTEDFYVSLGLPPMSDGFRRRSVFKCNESASFPGAAADMYKDDDVRVLYCSGTDFHDFYVLHHEFGHVQYFMAYKNQPGVFRQANTALHESIGDAIMYGVMTPQHLHRLRLINDAELYDTGHEDKQSDNTEELGEVRSSDLHISRFQNGDTNENVDYVSTNDKEEILNEIIQKGIIKDQGIDIQNDNEFENDVFGVDEIIMLKQMLNKVPQIPYSLLIENYRWRYFEGSLDSEFLNSEYWTMVNELMGVAPPIKRSEEYFDIGAELHVADNTPYIRYFMSSFLQHQIFENLCEASVFGRKDPNNILPESMPLNRCDIYGSKAAGKVLKDLMSRGSSQHWQVILNETIGEENISAAALLRYYLPLQKLLVQLAQRYDIPIGW